MTDPAPEHAVSIGLLLETAQSHQDLAEASLRRLQSHTAGLDEVVRDAVRRTVTAEYAALADHCNEVIESIRRLGRAATLRSLWTGAVLAIAPGVIVLAAVQYWLPSQSQIAALRTQQSILQENVTRLAQIGGRIDVRHCGDGGRLCVRVDRHAPIFGEHSDYFVIQGY